MSKRCCCVEERIKTESQCILCNVNLCNSCVLYTRAFKPLTICNNCCYEEMDRMDFIGPHCIGDGECKVPKCCFLGSLECPDCGEDICEAHYNAIGTKMDEHKQYCNQEEKIK